jgi:hypothetical protein
LRTVTKAAPPIDHRLSWLAMVRPRSANQHTVVNAHMDHVGEGARRVVTDEIYPSAATASGAAFAVHLLKQKSGAGR